MSTRSHDERLWQTTFAKTPHRLTPQRRSIMRELAAARKYLTAQELYARLTRSHPRIGLATVYRTLETLRALGLVSAVGRPGGENAYLYCGVGHHHHAVCTRCGKVDDVPCRAISAFERMLASGLQFRLTEHELNFYGVCARCS